MSPYLLTIYKLLSSQMKKTSLLFSCFRHIEGFLGFTRQELKPLEIEEHDMSSMSGNNTGENFTWINSTLF